MWVTAIEKPAGSEYKYHQKIWSLFPDKRKIANAPRPFVFRDIGRLLFILSGPRPNVSTAFNIESRIFEKESYAFSALCCAYRDGRGKNNPRGHRPRRPYLTDEDRINWFKRRLNESAAVRKIDIIPLPKRSIKKPGGREIKFIEFELSGVLHVLSRPLFLNVMLDGIGRSKAWGCGMIVLPEVMKKWSH